MADSVKFPTTGCVVEYLEGNAIQIAMVLEESGGKARLLLPSRREVKLALNRLLPWIGPARAASLSREDQARILEAHKKAREEKARAINPLEVWELAQGEIGVASASWFAELFESDPDTDTIAAYGHSLLECKTHFRFQPPDFQVHDAGTVEKRLDEQKRKEERDSLAAGGTAFLRLLWDLARQKKCLTGETADKTVPLPPDNVAGRLEKMLFARMLNPESQEDESLWQLVGKGLPELPHVPLQLLIAWGKLPPHYNFWLDRAGYDHQPGWWNEFAAEVARLEAIGHDPGAIPGAREKLDLPFISIDSAKTRDIDDAFHIERSENGWRLFIALANPALAWPFGGNLDKKILHRGTSIYLPEGDLHMLPPVLGTDAYSLLAGEERAAFIIRADIGLDGSIIAAEPFFARITLAANLNYGDAQEIISADMTTLPTGNPAAPFHSQLTLAHDFALARETARIAAGAIIMHRPEQEIILEGEGENTIVTVREEKATPDSQRLVAEMMILASGTLADWAAERGIPLLHRTQNVAVPREYAGVWSEPASLAKIIRALVPSILEVEARPHAALAMPRYAPATSPLRRYTDLVNVAQILNFREHGVPRWSAADLEALLESLAPALEGAGQTQRFRPRYWKLLYVRQMGDKYWWSGVITEENENFVAVSMPALGLMVRGKRNLFDERAEPGRHVRIRLGKVSPLYNEIQILETAAED